MKADEIRERFLKFFEERGHTIYPSDSLVPANDPTLLFTGAGMNQFKEEFLGRVKGSRRAATCQKCLRTGDLEQVGKTPDHHTFFEMLGNFSFGDYFKKEAIVWAWEFLTEDLGLKEEGLWVSVYKDDVEAYDIWKRVIKVPAKKILKLGERENFWPSNAPSEGPNGPCGPCSEIFYGGEGGVEVWNLVFTQFERKDNGRLEPLPNKNIDTGMGLERIARVIQGKDTNFEIDSFLPIVEAVKKLSDLKAEDPSTINAVADHVRAITFAIADRVLPSNEERGYVIRKLIRKAFWYGTRLGRKDEPFLYKLVPIVAKVMKKSYPELNEQREDISHVVLSEEQRFKKTIEAGTEKLEKIISSSMSTGIISGEDAFKLYDTYGFPLELTQEIAGENGIKVDIRGFDKCMQEQRAKSKQSSKIKDAIFADDLDLKVELVGHTPFIEDREETETKILQVKGNALFLKDTNFYGEKGGQVGDTGWLIKNDKVVAEVINAVDIAGRVQHEVRIKKGEVLKIGDKITARVDLKRRADIKKNHTATHLLHNALRKVLGQHVKQAGSLVAPDRLRFDFTHFKAVTDDEISRVEEIVNEHIRKNDPVDARELAFNEAKEQGAIALFGEKYGNKVRMVSVGDYSKELCGGTHVANTSEIGLFKIISESSIASGTRRIEAVTGEVAYKKIKEQEVLLKQIADELDVNPENIVREIEKMSDKLKNLERSLEDISMRVIRSIIGGLLNKIKRVNDNDVLITELKDADMSLLRKTADSLKTRFKKGVFVLVSEKEGKLAMVVGLCKNENINAVEILNDIGAGFNIKGGGRPDFAQAGARSGPDIKNILRKAEEVIKGI